MKWITRDEWRDRFAEVYDAHLQPACERSGVDVDEVVSILGEDFFMTTVWGSAFEDFLTRDFDDGRNIVEDYLKRRGWKESVSTRAYMTALRTSAASLYEVSDIIKDTSFRARDLVRGGDPVLISERSATRSLKQWDRIVARVVQVGGEGGNLAEIDIDGRLGILILEMDFAIGDGDAVEIEGEKALQHLVPILAFARLGLGLGGAGNDVDAGLL